MEETLSAVEDMFGRLGRGEAENAPRRHPSTGPVTLNLMGAAAKGLGAGLKAYTITKGAMRFVVLLWDPDSGDLQAIMEAGYMGAVRTGAASGVATKYMARKDAGTLGVLGSGGQSFTQVAAVCAVRNIDRVSVFSPTPEHRETLAARVRAELGIQATAVDSARAAAESDVICTITTSREPVLKREWIAPGTHINAAGAHWPWASELEGALVSAAYVALDDREQARIECGELLQVESADPEVWNRAVVLSDVVAGNARGRADKDQITIFNSLGIAAEDVAVARLVYDKAIKSGLGVELPVTVL